MPTPPVYLDDNGEPQGSVYLDENGNPIRGDRVRQGGIDSLITGEPVRPRANQTEDVLRSYIGGIPRGIAYMGGAVRDLNDLNGALVRWAGEQGARWRGANEQQAQNVGEHLSGDFQRIQAARDFAEPLMGPAGIAMTALRRAPSSQQYISAMEQTPVLGDVVGYQPQTRLGRYARTAGEFTPGLLMPGGGANAARQTVTQGVRRLGQRALTEVAAPAAASEAAGEATQGTPFEVPARILGAIAGHQAANATGQIISRGGMTPSDRALRIIERRLRQGNTSIDGLDANARALRRQGGDTAETIGEVGGKPLQRAARAVANVDGPGQGIADSYLAERTAGLGDRVVDEASRAAAPRQTRAPRGFYDARETLRAARSGQARESYAAAHNYENTLQGPQRQAFDQAVSTELVPYMRTAPRAAFESGARQLETEATRLRARVAEARMSGAKPEAVAAIEAELASVEQAGQQLGMFARGQIPNTVGSRAMDYFQRGLLQMERAAPPRSPEATAIGEARSAYNQMADRINPAFADARVRYGESIRIEELMDQGRRVFNMPEGEIEILLRGQGGRGLSMEEFDGFMLGVMDALQTKLRAGDTAFVARFMRNKNWQAQLERAFTPPPDEAQRALQAARRRSASRGSGRSAQITAQDIERQQQRMARASVQRLQNRIAREASMRGHENFVRGGSQTTPMAEDIKGLTQGESELGFLSEVIQSGGSVRGPALRLLARVWEWINRPGIYNPQINRELATRLFQPATTGNVKALRRELAALRARGIVLEAPVERDLIRAALFVQREQQGGLQQPTTQAPLEQRAASYSDAELERIASGGN